jgi:hypothetical protein
MKSLRVFALVLSLSAISFAGDREFTGLVHSFETTYGVHHLHIPLLGLALFVARPAGAHGLRLAVLEGFQTPPDPSDISRVVESSLGPGWYPFVRVRSKGETEGETTLIYTYPDGGKMRMVIVCIEPSEATLVKLNVTDHDIEKWLKEPGEEADGHSSHHLKIE